MHRFKIVLSIIVVLAVAFFVARGCVHKGAHRPAAVGGVVLPPVHKVPIKARPVRILPIIPQAIPLEPRIAIILDDWGYNARLLKNVDEIGRPVTLSILPGLPFSKKIAEEAYGRRLGVMLHMPMQPKSKKAALERRTILTTQTEAEIRRELEQALQGVPHAEGVNNHMGSAATSDLRVMSTVMRYLKERGLFFVDSEVIPTTVGPQVAKETGIRFEKRDVFLDNVMSAAAIKNELNRAKKIAIQTGSAVVIGHDKLLTLKIIKEEVPQLEKEGVRLVLVRDLVKVKEPDKA